MDPVRQELFTYLLKNIILLLSLNITYSYALSQGD